MWYMAQMKMHLSSSGISETLAMTLLLLGEILMFRLTTLLDTIQYRRKDYQNARERILQMIF